MNEKGTAYWNKVAEKYASRPVRDPAAFENMLADVSTRLASSDHVLELGCGTGTTAIRLAPHVAYWKAIDLSPEMIRIATSKIHPTNLEFQVSSAETAFDEKSFQVICAFHVLHLVNDVNATLDRICKSLAPGGLLISKTFCLGNLNTFTRGLISVLQGASVLPPARHLSAAELRQAMISSGLRIEEEKFLEPSRAFGTSLRGDLRIPNDWKILGMTER